MEENKTAQADIRPATATTPVKSGGPSANDPTADPHKYFCTLMGIDKSKSGDTSATTAGPTTTPLYKRVNSHYHTQRTKYRITATLSNSLLLFQILIGAVVTALSASKSPHVVTTVFGALNTVIAGAIAYMKSRGLPLRSRAFRDELEACVDSIDDAETRMWGWSVSEKFANLPEHPNGMGVEEQDYRIFVENEVDRLRKMYDAALENARMNYPDLWVKGQGDPKRTGTINKPDKRTPHKAEVGGHKTKEEEKGHKKEEERGGHKAKEDERDGHQ